MTANHSYQFLPCAKPQAVAITFAEEYVFNKIFDQSKVVKMKDGISLNVTIDQNMYYFGLQVHALLLKQTTTSDLAHSIYNI